MTAVMAGLGWLAGARALLLDFNPAPPAHKVPFAEVVGLVTAILLSWMLRPRLWHWQRLGRPRTRLAAALTALVGIALSTTPVLLSLTRIPPEGSLAWLISNALIIAATVFILAALLSPARGGALAFLAYAAHTALAETLNGPDPFLPLGTNPDYLPNPALATLLPLAAITIHAATHGRRRTMHD